MTGLALGGAFLAASRPHLNLCNVPTAPTFHQFETIRNPDFIFLLPPTTPTSRALTQQANPTHLLDIVTVTLFFRPNTVDVKGASRPAPPSRAQKDGRRSDPKPLKAPLPFLSLRQVSTLRLYKYTITIGAELLVGTPSLCTVPGGHTVGPGFRILDSESVRVPASSTMFISGGPRVPNKNLGMDFDRKLSAQRSTRLEDWFK
ncbi:hypothetical protein B0H14DRAFT_3619190 [Mycena olivaceomarginata]|nr:hypothetical protein B0H14DRAFT_3619190 [Mycena olivaceomarginata]